MNHVSACCEACAHGLPCEGSAPPESAKRSELGDASATGYSSSAPAASVPKQTAVAYAVMTMGVGMAIGGMLTMAILTKKSR